MAEIRLPEDMTKEEIVAEYMRMRELLDLSAKENAGLKKELFDLQTDYNDLKVQHSILNEKYKKTTGSEIQHTEKSMPVRSVESF